MAPQEGTSQRGPLARADCRLLNPDEKLPSAFFAESNASLPSWIAVNGNYTPRPRQGGIATFTTDLCNAIGGEYKRSQILVLAVNDSESHYE